MKRESGTVRIEMDAKLTRCDWFGHVFYLDTAGARGDDYFEIQGPADRIQLRGEYGARSRRAGKGEVLVRLLRLLLQ